MLEENKEAGSNCGDGAEKKEDSLTLQGTTHWTNHGRKNRGGPKLTKMNGVILVSYKAKSDLGGW